MAKFRCIVRTVQNGGTFDGNTPEVLSGYDPLPTQSARSYKASAVTVGRWGIGALGCKGNTPRAIAVRVYDDIQPGDRVEIRSGRPADEGNDSLDIEAALSPQDSLLETLTLGNTFPPFTLIGPTDSVNVFHDLLNGNIREDTVEFLVMEGTPAELAEIICCPPEDPNGCCCIEPLQVVIPSLEPGTYQLRPSGCTLLVEAQSEADGGILLLPESADAEDGAKVFIQRTGDHWFKVTCVDGINGVASPFGVVMDGREGVLFQNSRALGGWFANKVVPDLEPQDVTTTIAPFKDWAVREIHPEQPGNCVLPAASAVAERQLLWVTNTGNESGTPLEVNLQPQPGEYIDSEPDKQIVLTNFGDTVLILRDRSADGFRSVDNLFGRAQRLVSTGASPVTFTKGWRGRRSVLFTTQAAAATVNLPPSVATPIGCEILVASDLDDDPAVNVVANGADTIIGDGVNNATSTVAGPYIWAKFEYQGSGIWSRR